MTMTGMKLDLTINAVSVANLVTLILLLVTVVSAYNSIIHTQQTHGAALNRNEARIDYESGQRREAIAAVQARYEQLTNAARDAQERTVERLSKIEATQSVQSAVLQRVEAQLERLSNRRPE